MEDELAFMFESIMKSNPFNSLENEYNLRGVIQYFPNMCHVCRCFGDNAMNLKRCSACNLISYCGKEHQKQDWSTHKEFCKVMCKIKNELKVDNLFKLLKEIKSQQNVSTIREQLYDGKVDTFLEHLSSKAVELLKRKLKMFEMQMVQFPRVCTVCLESNPELLINCKKCPQSSFCKEHLNNPDHEKDCLKFILSSYTAPPSIAIIADDVKLSSQIKTENLPSTMTKFLEKYLTKNAVDSYSKETSNFFNASFSQKYSGTLSLVFAIEKLNLSLETMVIHIVGASFEEQLFNDWEIMFHHLKHLRKLTLIFIGLELMSRYNEKEKMCNSCRKGKKMITLEIKSKLYDEYCKDENFEKPDIIVCFNPGFHAYPTWNSAIEMFNQCPLVVTAYSQAEAIADQQIIEFEFPSANCVFNDCNPFASISYIRQKIGAPLASSNHFMFIYKNLGLKNFSHQIRLVPFW